MNEHLQDEQVIAIVSGDADVRWLEHSRGCRECRRAVEALREQLAAVRSEMTAWAARDEAFWSGQQAAIRRKMPADKTAPVALRWAAAAAVLAISAALLLSAGRQQPSGTAQAPQPDPDYALLVAVEQNLARPVPTAMEPARLLTADMDQAWRSAFSNNSQNLQDNADRR